MSLDQNSPTGSSTTYDWDGKTEFAESEADAAENLWIEVERLKEESEAQQQTIVFHKKLMVLDKAWTLLHTKLEALHQRVGKAPAGIHLTSSTLPLCGLCLDILLFAQQQPLVPGEPVDAGQMMSLAFLEHHPEGLRLIPQFHYLSEIFELLHGFRNDVNQIGCSRFEFTPRQMEVVMLATRQPSPLCAIRLCLPAVKIGNISDVAPVIKARGSLF
ncbi:hypothetical protein LTR70_004863 [Exophiala xenobiotica]|uniref:Uncharacterized protein n=1 Tax=Lithohypha guttulata TaxID=1690604 RepID=A0ABR0KBU6_9EURO|nr:hypothetical protein LTR24_004481 [Lithohypha guttulata]KAK5319818.1 hypothetical protein LTR70_004863 [Exophiala xenobiotica]